MAWHLGLVIPTITSRSILAHTEKKSYIYRMLYHNDSDQQRDHFSLICDSISQHLIFALSTILNNNKLHPLSLLYE
jgi:hypothetical protein